MAHILRLVVDVGYIAVERRRSRGPCTRRDPGSKPADEGVRVPAAAMHLERKVETLLLHARKETLQILLVFVHARVRTVDPRGGGDGDRAVGRTGSFGEELLVPHVPEQRDLCLRISCLKRMKSRQREDEVSDTAGPQDGDLAHVLYPLRA